MDQELEDGLFRIISGKLIFKYKSNTYILKSPSINLKYKACLLYNSIIHEEKYNEWIRFDSLDKFMEYLDVWDKSMGEFLKNSDKKLEDLKVSLYNNRFNSKMTIRTRNQLGYIRNKIVELQNIKQSYYTQTLEGYAESIKYEYIIINTLYNGKNKVFNKFGSVQNSYNDFTDIVNEINKHSISTSLYRKIARSDLWRSYWGIDKNNIFNGPVSSWTEEQRMLAGYSAMYDSVFSHPEKPSDNVIEDDDMLDGWMIAQRREIEKNKQQESMVKSSPKLGKAQEVFIFTDSAEGAKEIIDMNSPEALLTMAQRTSAINKNNNIDHTMLPDVQKELLHK